MMHFFSLPKIFALVAALVAVLPACAVTPQGAAAINERIDALRGRSYDDAVLRLYQNRLLTMLPLIRDGENVNTTKGNESGSTALHYACGLGDAELVEVLLACGADPSIKTAKGASTELCIGSDPGGRIRKLLSNPKKAVLPAVDTAAPAPVPAPAHTATADWAPADVSNRTVKIQRSMELEAFRDEGWEWKPSQDASPVTLKFQQGNTYVPLQGKDAPGKGYGNQVTYKKTGPATATITVATWEQEVTYTLEFTSKKGGNVTTDAHCEGTEWKARDATFIIR